MVWKIRPEILLCPNVPKPLHTLAPRNILGQSWWNATRKAAYKSTNYRCQACGVSKLRAKYHQWLEGHELYHIDYARGRSVYVETVPLCHFCHNYIHDGRLEWLLRESKIHHHKYTSILQHGDEVLRGAGLTKLSHAERDAAIANQPCAPWEEWRLVLFGEEYAPVFPTFEDWRLHFLQENQA